jgi:hypothetical protein
MDNARKLVAYCWIAIVTVALILSNYSLEVVSHHYGLPNRFPMPLAWLLSIPFDGAALVAGNLTLRYARELGSNGSGPKMFVISLAAISAWLNSQHASILRLGIPAHILYACPPIVAVILFELNMRFEYRRALQEANRTVEPLPVFGIASWLFHLVSALKAISEITGKRLEYRTAKAIEDYTAVEAVIINETPVTEIPVTETPAIETEYKEPANTSRESTRTYTSKAHAIRAAYTELGEDIRASRIREWCADHGYEVDEAYIRTVKNQARIRDARTRRDTIHLASGTERIKS